MKSSRQLDRRKFIQQSGQTLAGAAAGLALLPGKTGAASRNDIIGAAVVGFRGRGKSHINAFLDLDGVQVVALCDVDENLWEPMAKRVEEKQGRRPQMYPDLRRLLEDPEVDVVSTATPQSLACTCDHLGLPGRQGCLRGEACLLGIRRRRTNGGSRP